MSPILTKTTFVLITLTLIHDAYPIEAMAADLGTISYEIMTTLGQRADWHYHGG